MTDDADTAATVRDWTDVLRRIRFGPRVTAGGSRPVAGATVRAVALMLATYADSDGSRAFPGVARLAVACELDYRTTRRALAALRAYGLITRVQSRRGGEDADEYQLTLPADLLDTLDVLTPTAMTLAARRVRAAARRRTPPPPDPPGTGARDTRTPDPVRVPHAPVPPVDNTATPVDNPPVRVRETPVHHPAPSSRTGAPNTRTSSRTGASDTPVRVRETPPTHHYLDTTTTSHPQRELGVREPTRRAREPQTDSPPMPNQCPHGLHSRLRDDGQPTCALCRRDQPATLAPVIPLRTTA